MFNKFLFLRYNFNWRDVIKKFICRAAEKMLILMVSTSVSVIKDAPFYWMLLSYENLSFRHLHHHKLWCRFCSFFSRTSENLLRGNLKFMDMALWTRIAVNANPVNAKMKMNCDRKILFLKKFFESSSVSHGEGINLIKSDIFLRSFLKFLRLKIITRIL